MFSNDLANIIYWWLIWFLVGLTFLPLTIKVFSNFFDQGYALAKILGALIICFLTWLLGSLHILPFNQFTIFLILIPFLIFNIYQLSKSLKLLKLPKLLILEEFLFFLGLFFWSFIRMHEPSIHGLEKFMDYGFINSILKTDYFPPKDLWLTPFSINYYYFGHFTSALFTKLSGLPSEITYNLTLATIFALTLSASFSIGANLYNFFSQKIPTIHHTPYTILSGLLASFLVTLGGNLHTIYMFFQTYNPEAPVPFWQLPLMFNPTGYWYPNATRFIPFTIHEFPIYSFVVADLHGHVFNIPFVLLTIAMLIKIFFQKTLLIFDFLLLSLLIAVSLMTNVLDGPIYLLVIFVVLLVKNNFLSDLRNLGNQRLLTPITQTLIIAFGAVIFSLPFWLNFIPFGSGIGVACAPEFLINIGKIGPFLFEANHCSRSPFWMMLILWGFPLFIVLSFIYHLLPDAPLSSFNILKIKNLDLFKNYKLKISNSDLLALTLSLTAFLLILIPEFFYVKDIYPAHWRANTVFKFGYQAFIILGFTSAYMITRLIANFKIQISKLSFIVFFTFAFLLFTLVAIYPYFAINSYYLGSNSKSLNGLSYLSDLYPDDYKAIIYLKDNIQGQPVILEAQGDSYTDYARVSVNTGLPTVVGWPVHEWLWRGSYDEAGKRVTEVTTLYESADLNLTKQLIDKYKVKYVFVGSLERQKYLNLNEEKFNHLGKEVFQSNNTRVYQID